MKFIVSFTTSPTRINKCGPMIHSILDQTRKPDLFLLNIPETFARTGESYVIPKYIRKSLTVNQIDVDYGPATKILPAVMYLRERAGDYDPENTRIIYLDDDIAYPKRMIETYEKTISAKDEDIVPFESVLEEAVERTGNRFLSRAGSTSLSSPAKSG